MYLIEFLYWYYICVSIVFLENGTVYTKNWIVSGNTAKFYLFQKFWISLICFITLRFIFIPSLLENFFIYSYINCWILSQTYLSFYWNDFDFPISANVDNYIVNFLVLNQFASLQVDYLLCRIFLTYCQIWDC